MQAEIVVTGDEITSGQILDTNSRWLSQRLEELGVHVLYHTAVGDHMDAIVGVLRQAMARSDIVLVTGGLGPTPADLTREAVARAAGRKLRLDPQALEHIRHLFARRKREMPKRNEVQAMMPEGARVVRNPNGTAPGIDMDLPREGGRACRLVALPGVPAEVREMWTDSVAALLRRAGAGQRTIVHRNINTFGVGESQVVEMLPGVVGPGRKPHVGINASQATIILRIDAEGATEEECHAAIEPTVKEIREKLGDLVYGEEDEGLEHAVVRLLRQQHKTLAVAEWGTAGLVTGWLAAVAEGQGFFRGGLVVGDRASAEKSLGLAPDLVARHGPESVQVAEAMAVGARERFANDFGLAVGPFPKPDPQAAEPEPAALALAGPGGVKSRAIPFAGHPDLIKVLFAKHALNLARLQLIEAGRREVGGRNG